MYSTGTYVTIYTVSAVYGLKTEKIWPVTITLHIPKYNQADHRPTT